MIDNNAQNQECLAVIDCYNEQFYEWIDNDRQIEALCKIAQIKILNNYKRIIQKEFIF